jgi:hypothetical protein
MGVPQKKIEKPPEHRVFEEALSTALSVPKQELRRRLAESEPEKVSRYERYKYVPAKPQS